MNITNSTPSLAAPRREAARQQTRHISADFLGLHVLGDLPILQRSEVEEHLARCGSCRIALRRVAELIAVFRTDVCEAA